jgi:hypothetical protein
LLRASGSLPGTQHQGLDATSRHWSRELVCAVMLDMCE